MDRKLRNTILQLAFVGTIVALVSGFVLTAQSNLREQGITSGFGFLERGTGWDMGFSFFPFSISDPYWWTLLMGFLNTIVVGYLAMALATFIGVGLAAMRISNNVVLDKLALVYIDLIRNIPPILQVFAWYALFTGFPSPRNALSFGDAVFFTSRGVFFPALNITTPAVVLLMAIFLATVVALLWIGFGRRFMFTTFRVKAKLVLATLCGATVTFLAVVAASRLPDTSLIAYPELQGFNFQGGVQMPPELTTILVATMVYGSAYIAEIVRGGFLSVDRGKIEAGRALGLSGWVIFTRIQLPLTVQNILPMMTNLYVWLIKATTLGVAIGFADLFAVTVSSINQSGQTIEFILILATAFWAINNGLVWIMNRINTRMQRRYAR